MQLEMGMVVRLKSKEKLIEEGFIYNDELKTVTNKSNIYVNIYLNGLQYLGGDVIIGGIYKNIKNEDKYFNIIEECTNPIYTTSYFTEECIDIDYMKKEGLKKFLKD